MKAWSSRGHIWNETRHEKELCYGVKTPKDFLKQRKLPVQRPCGRKELGHERH